MATSTETFQLSVTAAELYESKFVPAFFAEWAPHLVDLAGVGPGQAVLDVACGTGIVARTVADRLAGTGRVVGVDLNEAMLTVARRVRPDIEWRQGDAGGAAVPGPRRSTRPVPDGAHVLPGPARGACGRCAGRRAWRHGGAPGPGHAGRPSRPTGRSSRWRRATPGPRPRSLLGAYFACGDLAELTALVEAAGLAVTATRTRPGPRPVRLGRRVRGGRGGEHAARDRISEEVYARIREGARGGAPAVHDAAGRVEVPLEGPPRRRPALTDAAIPLRPRVDRPGRPPGDGRAGSERFVPLSGPGRPPPGIPRRSGGGRWRGRRSRVPGTCRSPRRPRARPRARRTRRESGARPGPRRRAA